MYLDVLDSAIMAYDLFLMTNLTVYCLYLFVAIWSGLLPTNIYLPMKRCLTFTSSLWVEIADLQADMACHDMLDMPILIWCRERDFFWEPWGMLVNF